MSRALLLLAVVLLPACSSLEKERLVYQQSQSIAPLKIPAGLDAPQGENELPVPTVNMAEVGVDVAPPVNLPQETPTPATKDSQPAAGSDSADN